LTSDGLPVNEFVLLVTGTVDVVNVAFGVVFGVAFDFDFGFGVTLFAAGGVVLVDITGVSSFLVISSCGTNITLGLVGYL
jgi:hypothetical protein